MRDLLDLLDLINENSVVDESRGLSARKPGEQFQRNADGKQDIITFQSLDFYPESGAYNSSEEMMQMYNKVIANLNPKPEAVNKPSSATGAFALAKFDTEVGPRYLVKFAQKINPIREKNTFWKTSDIPGGFSQVSARGSKEKVGYKPSDVLTNFKSQTPQDILQQIAAKFGADSHEYNAAKIITSAKTFPVSVPAGNMDFAGFRDYFCEMLQPIVLINGAQVKGNAAEAAKIFLGGNYSKCVISFNTSVSGGLYDSLLVAPNGKQIKLSSKGATGAMASSVNLLKSVQELEQAGMTQFREQYAEVVDILETIHRGDHNSGPLNLAVQLGMIKPAEVDQVMSLAEYPGGDNFDIDDTRISPNLKKIYKERNARNPSKIVPLNHMVSSIAYKVVNEINMKTNFSEAAADILNNSAFVQMYTDAKQSKDQFIIQGFTTVWPSKLFTEVTLEAEKSYSSTASSGGKLVFNINKEPKVVPNTDESGGVDRDANVADYIPGNTEPEIEPRANRSKVTARGVDRTDDKNLGRKRR